MIAPIVVGLVTSSFWRGANLDSWKAGVLVGGVSASPLLGAVGGFLWWVRRMARGIASKRSRRDQALSELGVLARVLLMGVSSGQSLHGALVTANREVVGGVGDHVSSVLKQFRTSGMAAALVSVAGPATPLFVQLAGASASGGPSSPVIASFLHEHLATAKAHRLAEMRKLPIKLTIPLTLLILPGCVLLFVGPSFVRGVADLLPNLGAL